MAMLAGYGLFLIDKILPTVPSRANMLSLSRMSIGWDVDDLLTNLNQRNQEYDGAILEQIRSMGGRFSSKEFFELLGFKKYDDLDFDDSEGATIIHDMNTPVPEALHNCFDFVFENGTLEHIFDIKTAISNVARMVKVGGVVSHGSPLDAFNHGFYNFSINFFNDFYRANGFDDLEFYVVRYSSNWRHNQKVNVEALPYTFDEFSFDPGMYTSELNKAYIACRAQKTEHVSKIISPVQAAYDRNKGHQSLLTKW
ncbi:MAG: hypothetical protein HOB79_04425 [Rhodospirillaceae bacterium]|nr:hypothetical protein [Rhodospirillales bacterium]MBT3905034.1 hypothetical protein [Rhodospirillaceae bacterium]MBT4700298.1 hypothetical protein [Rhodospirillaceae bacterium]MBT5034158.1 hypothetical protein [Rhodospirillaceae bacterium]MBT6220848.1 hypothetical protein [Rhodospirillaceae bacterium]